MAMRSRSDGSDSGGDINPYAAPRYYAERSPADAQAGIWRDGRFLVLHEDARLPPVCIRTGAPAECFHWHSIRWCYPIDLCMRTARLEVPLTHEAHQAFFSGRRRLTLGIFSPLAFVSLMIAVASLWQDRDISVPVALVVLGVVLLAALLVACAISSVVMPDLLWFKRARRGYLWLGGADERFLAQLPPWTKM